MFKRLSNQQERGMNIEIVSFVYLCGLIIFWIMYDLAINIKTKRDYGIAILMIFFWPIATVYYSIKYFIKFIVWSISCVLSIFIDSVVLSTGNVDFEQPKINEQKNTCDSCGSGKQYGSVCNRCGAPL
jgi:hypothetical protein